MVMIEYGVSVIMADKYCTSRLWTFTTTYKNIDVL